MRRRRVPSNAHSAWRPSADQGSAEPDRRRRQIGRLLVRHRRCLPGQEGSPGAPHGAVAAALAENASELRGRAAVNRTRRRARRRAGVARPRMNAATIPHPATSSPAASAAASKSCSSGARRTTARPSRSGKRQPARRCASPSLALTPSMPFITRSPIFHPRPPAWLRHATDDRSGTGVRPLRGT